jgi:hypothetical protein
MELKAAISIWLMVLALGRIEEVLLFPLTPPAVLAMEFFLALAVVCAPLALSRRPRGLEDVLPVW